MCASLFSSFWKVRGHSRQDRWAGTRAGIALVVEGAIVVATEILMLACVRGGNLVREVEEEEAE
jgi:hypothetical protein